MEHTVIQVIATMMVFLTLSFKPVSSEVDITRTGCGKTKFCLAVPDDCDPAGSGSCLFGSVKPTAINIPNGVDMAFELSGNSEGYIAIGLIPNNSELLNFFSCGKNSGSFFFRSSIANQTSTTEEEEPMETTVTGNSTNGVNIKCTFTVAKVNASKISSARTTENITYSVIIGSGNVENGKSRT
ncbi:PREDICTED: putative ferric-chelate reductase 1 [Cyprinodon variegatus]|uniref:putative ferric-chelate reductase 1 n=1 Tax=Cyprinodon variegatus TaxID=28743 RepID=UPI000742A269|nr:PREDICTED: putative ferric-chelate reductase 1 [Cyprinodon variegatus]